LYFKIASFNDSNLIAGLWQLIRTTRRLCTSNPNLKEQSILTLRERKRKMGK